MITAYDWRPDACVEGLGLCALTKGAAKCFKGEDVI